MTDSKNSLNISAKSFLGAIAVIFLLMLATYILSFVIPGGEYIRAADANGNLVIDAEAGFRYVDGGLPFWKWLLSPVLVLGADGSAANTTAGSRTAAITVKRMKDLPDVFR